MSIRPWLIFSKHGAQAFFKRAFWFDVKIRDATEEKSDGKAGKC